VSSPFAEKCEQAECLEMVIRNLHRHAAKLMQDRIFQFGILDTPPPSGIKQDVTLDQGRSTFS